MTQELKIWIDDIRKPLPGYNVWFKNDFHAFIEFVKCNRDIINEFSFDHDLGHSLNGLNLITIVEMLVFHEYKFPKLETIYIHTANGATKRPMMHSADRIHNGLSLYRDYDFSIDGLFDTWFPNGEFDQETTSRKRVEFFNTPFEGQTF